MLPHQPSDPAATTGKPSPTQAYPFRVLLQVPETRHIPTFAMGVEKGRAAEEATLTSVDAVADLIGDSTAHALQAGRHGAYGVIASRTRLNPRTALYCMWVAFAAADHAEAFQREHPMLGLAAIIGRIEAALGEHQAGGHDGSADTFERLHSGLRALELLRQSVATATYDQWPEVSS